MHDNTLRIRQLWPDDRAAQEPQQLRTVIKGGVSGLAVPVTAVPGLDGHARALDLLLLLLEQPPAVRAAATTSAAPATTDRRGPVILALLLMANPSIGQPPGKVR
jgi:hypothetical protein